MLLIFSSNVLKHFMLSEFQYPIQVVFLPVLSLGKRGIKGTRSKYYAKIVGIIEKTG